MPMFDFKCLSCRTVFETLVSRPIYTEDGHMIGVKCPHCGNKQPHNFIKQISIGTSFHLKGDGWYKDGYSSKKGND